MLIQIARSQIPTPTYPQSGEIETRFLEPETRRMRGARVRRESEVERKGAFMKMLARRWGRGRGRGRTDADEEERVGQRVAYNPNHSHAIRTYV